MSAARGFGHGKVILLGEHAVVFGQPAIAAGIPVGVEARVTPGPGRVRIPAWGVDARLGDGSPVSVAVERLLGHLQVPAADVDVDATLPARAGLGSSAAFAVAVARACGGDDEAKLLGGVAQAEAVFHGSPSGIDAAAALHGGVGWFTRQEGWRPLPVGRRLELLVGLSGKARDTRAQVEGVERLCARTPAARRLIEALGEVTRAGAGALADGDVDGLGRLFDVAHGLLAGLRVSTAELDAMVHAARAAGAAGAKLTGAGGGGSVIALAPSRGRDVLAAWRALGFEGFETAIGPCAA